MSWQPPQDATKLFFPGPSGKSWARAESAQHAIALARNSTGLVGIETSSWECRSRPRASVRLAGPGGKVHPVARIAKGGRAYMFTVLLIIHGLLAVALLGAITHQTVSVWWPARKAAGFVGRFRSVPAS